MEEKEKSAMWRGIEKTHEEEESVKSSWGIFGIL